jgi:hypothetical protein
MQGFYQQDIGLYRRQQWDEAKAAFQALRLFHRASPPVQTGMAVRPSHRSHQRAVLNLLPISLIIEADISYLCQRRQKLDC